MLSFLEAESAERLIVTILTKMAYIFTKMEKALGDTLERCNLYSLLGRTQTMIGFGTTSLDFGGAVQGFLTIHHAIS